jgi:hypothetical protein
VSYLVFGSPNLHSVHSVVCAKHGDARRILVSLLDDGPMRPKPVTRNKYSIVKY